MRRNVESFSADMYTPDHREGSSRRDRRQLHPSRSLPTDEWTTDRAGSLRLNRPSGTSAASSGARETSATVVRALRGGRRKGIVLNRRFDVLSR